MGGKVNRRVHTELKATKVKIYQVEIQSKVTIYSCRTVNRKYSFYKQTDRESASMVSESENIKNIKYYVKYIEK